jgi:hypothetical protein
MAGLLLSDPINLHVGMTGDNIIPGDTLLLRGGTYLGTWLNEIAGTAELPVTIKPYNNERVIISGDFSDATEYVTYIDIEFVTIHDPNPALTPAGKYHDFSGSGVKIINCTLHDSDGAGFWDNADLFYGCISYNHGVVVGEVGSGHSLYTQNQTASHKKTIKHSIFGRSANYGLHVFSTNFPATNIDIIENVLLPGSNHLIGSQHADDGILFSGNHVYGHLILGYWDEDHTNLTMENNILHSPDQDPLQLDKWVSGSMSGNTIVVSGAGERDVLVYINPAGAKTIAINNNTYYNTTGKADCFNDDGIGWKTLAQWRTAYGFDTNSTLSLDSSLPADSVHVYVNEYANVSRRKGLVVIHNWSEAATVDVDLSSLGIAEGTACKLLQAQDPLGDQRSFNMPANGVVSVTMSGTIASVSGWTDPATTFPTFGAFVVETE